MLRFVEAIIGPRIPPPETDPEVREARERLERASAALRAAREEATKAHEAASDAALRALDAPSYDATSWTEHERLKERTDQLTARADQLAATHEREAAAALAASRKFRRVQVERVRRTRVHAPTRPATEALVRETSARLPTLVSQLVRLLRRVADFSSEMKSVVRGLEQATEADDRDAEEVEAVVEGVEGLERRLEEMGDVLDATGGELDVVTEGLASIRDQIADVVGAPSEPADASPRANELLAELEDTVSSNPFPFLSELGTAVDLSEFGTAVDRVVEYADRMCDLVELAYVDMRSLWE